MLQITLVTSLADIRCWKCAFKCTGHLRNTLPGGGCALVTLHKQSLLQSNHCRGSLASSCEVSAGPAVYNSPETHGTFADSHGCQCSARTRATPQQVSAAESSSSSSLCSPGPHLEQCMGEKVLTALPRSTSAQEQPTTDTPSCSMQTAIPSCHS